MTVSKKVLTRLAVAGLILLAGVTGVLITKNSHNAIHVTNKTIADERTTDTLANYAYHKADQQLINVANFNPNQVSGIKTLYVASRLHKDANHYLATTQFNQENRLFLFSALKSKITGKDNLSQTNFGPLNALDVYVVKALQAQKILTADYKYTTSENDTKLMHVLRGDNFNVNSALTGVTKFNLLKSKDNTANLNDLLANILILRQAKLTDEQMRKLERVWEGYQQRNITKLALTMSDKSFILLAEFEKNLSQLLQQNSFFDLKANDVTGIIYQPESYQLDSYRNIAFWLAGQYYTQNKVNQKQLKQVVDKLRWQERQPKTASDAYYLSVINQVLKTKIRKAVDIPPAKQMNQYDNKNFYNYLVTNSQPDMINGGQLLNQVRFYGLHDMHPAGKKYLQELDIDTILTSPVAQRSAVINEYVLALKKYNLLTPQIKVKILHYIDSHEDSIFGYTLEANQAFTLTSAVFALQVKSVLVGGGSLDIH